MLQIKEPTYKWAYALTRRTTTTHLIIHHAAGNGAVEGIHAYHLSKGWAGITYHYYVRRDGTIYRGRPENMRGGHTTNWNYCSIGICFEGNFEAENMSDAQLTAGQELVADIVSRYPSIIIGRHSEFGQTSCPGKNFPFEFIAHPTDEGTAEDKPTEPSAWAASDCAWAVDKGIFKGDGNGNFRWHDTVTREELAALLHRMEGLK